MPNVLRDDSDVAVVILGGGEATRCPGKLERPIGGLPMLVRTCRNLQGTYPMYLCVSRELTPAVKAQIDAELIFDRAPHNGPLTALRTGFEVVRQSRAFVVAADMPFVHAGTLRHLVERWQSGDEAVVALDEGGAVQPLLALYDRAAFIRAAAIDREWNGVKDLLAGLRWRGVVLESPVVMLNVNTEDQYRAAVDRFAAGVPA